MQAFKHIVNEINKFQIKHNAELDLVVVENVFKVTNTELKLTVELIGMLKAHYRGLIRLHHPSTKSKELIETLIKEKGKKNEHAIHARAILESHISNKEHKCLTYHNVKIKEG